MPPRNIKDVVTSVLYCKGKILILHRSGKVGTYRGYWAGVSGHIESGDTPEDRALIEIEEETGIRRKDVKILAKGKTVYTQGENSVTWRVHPFLVESKTRNVKIDWEHTGYRWIEPGELGKYNTTPNFNKVAKDLLELLK